MRKELGIILTFLLILLLIPFISALITTNEITETSIVWNLSNLSGVTINSIAFDGMTVTGYEINSSRIVQNNLYRDETHIIRVVDTLGNVYEASAKTLPQITNPLSTTGFLFGMVYLLIALVILFIASRLPVLGLISAMFCVIGIIKGIQDTSFLSFLLYIITLVICLYVTDIRVNK